MARYSAGLLNASVSRRYCGASQGRTGRARCRESCARLPGISENFAKRQCWHIASAAVLPPGKCPRTAPRLACADLGACQALLAGWRRHARPRSPPPDPAKRHPVPYPSATRGVTGVVGRQRLRTREHAECARMVRELRPRRTARLKAAQAGRTRRHESLVPFRGPFPLSQAAQAGRTRRHESLVPFRGPFPLSQAAQAGRTRRMRARTRDLAAW